MKVQRNATRWSFPLSFCLVKLNAVLEALFWSLDDRKESTNFLVYSKSLNPFSYSWQRSGKVFIHKKDHLAKKKGHALFMLEYLKIHSIKAVPSINALNHKSAVKQQC